MDEHDAGTGIARRHGLVESRMRVETRTSDLDCADFNITDIPITGTDPNGLDREGDGVGCES